MKITINAKTLADGLSSVSKAVDSKCSLGILRDIQISTNEDSVVLVGGDGEITLQVEVGCTSIEERGGFAVGAFTFTDAIKGLPDQPITLRTTNDGKAIEVNYQQGHFSMPIDNASEYPALAIKEEEKMHRFSMNGEDIKRILNYTVVMTGADMLRPVMSGVYFDSKEEGQLNIVASDGHLLARTIVKNTTNSVSSLNMPKKVVNLLRSVMGEEDCIIKYDEKVGIVESGAFRMEFRLVEGRYPNYNSVIPNENILECMVSRPQLLAAVRRVKPFASDASDLLTMNFHDGICTLEAVDFDFSKAASETINISLDKPLCIGFKADNLISALNCFDCENVTLHFTDPSRPMTITSDDNEHYETLSMCMPMLIQDYER